ncbi:DUF1566 domain-containing protein [bacterium]|nr:DUF1566 domain-containing protein [bacterium]
MKKFFVQLFLFVTFLSITLLATAEENADTQACNYARRSNDVKVWEAYLRKFPKGTCAFIAETELEKHGIAIPNGQATAPSAPGTIPCARGCTDPETGYMWSALAPSTMISFKAIDYCENLKEGGYSDWRLPTRNILKTISYGMKSKFGDTGRFCHTEGVLNFENGNSYAPYNSYGWENKGSVRCVR